MRKLIVSTWITIDGIFDATSMGQWFAPFDSEARQQYIREGILGSDTLLLGRHTYEMLHPYWSSLKNNEMGVAGQLNSMAKYVVSSTMKKADWENTSVINGDLVTAVNKLKQEPGKEIQVEGSGILVQSLAAAGLVDEYRLLVHPVVMGSGLRFFKDSDIISRLELIGTQTFDKGVVLLRYQAGK
ncbi:dihydrofolate reductase family protein [Chitinophaga vietnamensis]|uniref:dihydrofolate reductase family protein n=1 Tax=Chitinophaga vietnamensis TaxID=2593957 RepID=UPI0011774BB8|nr:dihydrofolate reductase family protein [Chitinophaga vietnamensis]